MKRNVLISLFLIFTTCSQTTSVHIGMYDYYEFLNSNYFTFEDDKEEFYYFYFDQVGPNSGTYLYKDSQYDLIMYSCEDDGFTKEECETTATYEWENENTIRSILFNDFSCSKELNNFVKEYIDQHKTDYIDQAYPRTGSLTHWKNQIKLYVPKLTQDIPTEYITIIAWGYYDSGGTMRYPYADYFTFDLNNCSEVFYDDLVKAQFNVVED